LAAANTASVLRQASVASRALAIGQDTLATGR
jgi:hypothetical protein